MPMLRRSLLSAGATGILVAGLPPAADAAASVGRPAPEFAATDSNGKTVSLAGLRGKIVVLEWTNDGCPFVGKWYRSGAMQALQKEAAQLGIVWLSVISSAPGEQGFADGARADQLTRERGAAPAHVLLDPKGVVGRLYDAETTPQIFVVDAQGVLRYAGGADSIASSRESDLAKATPYARLAIEAVSAGKPVPFPVTRPYGCSVKYG
jgi:peroxiredoxin